jgi:amino acid permease
MEITRKKKRVLTIWSFVAFIFIIYGLVIAGAGVYYWLYEPPKIALANLNPSLFWGLFLLVIGLIFNWGDLRSERKQNK